MDLFTLHSCWASYAFYYLKSYSSLIVDLLFQNILIINILPDRKPPKTHTFLVPNLDKQRLLKFELYIFKFRCMLLYWDNDFGITLQQFHVRTTSKSSSFDYYMLKNFQFLKIKVFSTNLASLGHKIWIVLQWLNHMFESLETWEWCQTLFR